MKKLIISITGFFFFNMAIAQVSYNKEDALVEKLIKENNIIGAAAAYSINGEIVWQNSQGYLDQKNKKTFDSETKLRIASIAKSMTAIAVMQLVEQELIDLDAPIQTYIKDYPTQAKTQITTRHLLSHTSGIGGYKDGKEAETCKEYEKLSDALGIFKDRALKFEPGTQYSYTTYGYTVLGVIIENVSQQSFEEYMRANIWDKAGMNDTGVEKYGSEMKNQSVLYHQNKKVKTKVAKENNLSNRLPGGGFYSTINDMMKFGHAILNHTFVKESTLDLMREHHSLEKEANGYGFGFFLYNPKPNEGAIIGHSGAQTGSCTQFVIVPSKNIVVVVLSNTSGTYKYVTPTAFNLLNLALEKTQ